MVDEQRIRKQSTSGIQNNPNVCLENDWMKDMSNWKSVMVYGTSMSYFHKLLYEINCESVEYLNIFVDLGCHTITRDNLILLVKTQNIILE